MTKQKARNLVGAFLQDAINFRGAKNNAITHVQLSSYEDELILEINKLDYI